MRPACRFERLLCVLALLAGCAILGCGGGASDQQGTVPQSASNSETLPPEPPEEPFTLEQGFQLLGLDDFDVFGDAESWSQTGRTIACIGKPRGYIYTKNDYVNFTLRLDYRFPRPDDLTDDAAFAGNTGVLVYTADEHKLWPVSLEVQGKYSEMATIKANGGAEAVEIADDETSRRQARRPVGEWNALEIVSHDGVLTASINGTIVCQNRPGELTSGRLGIQSEDYEFEIRNLRIREH